MTPVPFELWHLGLFLRGAARVEWKEDLTKGRPQVCPAQLAVPLRAHAAIVLPSRQGVPEEATARPSITQHV